MLQAPRNTTIDSKQTVHVYRSVKADERRKVDELTKLDFEPWLIARTEGLKLLRRLEGGSLF